jgi:hypothetical protein
MVPCGPKHVVVNEIVNNITLWPKSMSELYRPSGRHLAKLGPTFADRKGGVTWSAQRIPYSRNLSFLDWNEIVINKKHFICN